MRNIKQQYREGTRAARFLRIRDAIMTRSHEMRPFLGELKALAAGPFFIIYGPPGANGIGRGYNLQIWPNGTARCGVAMHGHKVANVDWNQWDEVDILSFKRGEWEDELLELLAAPTNVIFLPRR